MSGRGRDPAADPRAGGFHREEGEGDQGARGTDGHTAQAHHNPRAGCQELTGYALLQVIVNTVVMVIATNW